MKDSTRRVKNCLASNAGVSYEHSLLPIILAVRPLNEHYHPSTNRQVLASGFKRLHRDSHPYRLED
jgi:hypothetical protein